MEEETLAVLEDLRTVVVHAWGAERGGLVQGGRHFAFCVGVMRHSPKNRACSSKGKCMIQSSLTLWSTTISVMKITAMLHLKFREEKLLSGMTWIILKGEI